MRKGKIPGKENPADLLTKYLPGVKVAEISRSLGFFVEGGRSDIVDAANCGCCLNNSGGSQRWVAGAEKECRQH